MKERQTSTQISVPVLSIQAHKSCSNLQVDNPSDFVVPRGRLHCFQCQHGINQVKFNGEPRPADRTAITAILTKYIADNDLGLDQI